MVDKYVSDFVKKQKALSARHLMKLIWNSSLNGTYIRNKHGKLI